jgi:hypothetical protein
MENELLLQNINLNLTCLRLLFGWVLFYLIINKRNNGIQLNYIDYITIFMSFLTLFAGFIMN